MYIKYKNKKELITKKMKKGISPVVAVVLLIAIAVIAAVGVWYWIGSYTGAPTAIRSSLKTITVQKCNGTSVYIQNIGTENLTGTAKFYDDEGTPMGTLNFSALSTKSVGPGESAWVPLYQTNSSPYTTEIASNKQYTILESGYMTTPFTC